jgi:hypothetical protein
MQKNQDVTNLCVTSEGLMDNDDEILEDEHISASEGWMDNDYELLVLAFEMV